MMFFLMLFLGYSFSVEASELYGTIWYKGKPLQNAEVAVKDNKIQTTNAKGYYSIELPPGLYTLGIKLPDGKIRQEKVNVFPQDTEKNLQLE
jgi:hypothetical protein